MANETRKRVTVRLRGAPLRRLERALRAARAANPVAGEASLIREALIAGLEALGRAPDP